MVNKYWFTIWYFKPNGKFYTETSVQWELKSIADTNCPYMNDAVAKLRGLRDRGGQGAMPGLSAMTEGWDGPILIKGMGDTGFPCLIMPNA